MPAVSPAIIVESLLSAFQDSNATAYYIPVEARTHPRKFIVEKNGQSLSIWIYIWSLTHGGRPALPNEFRIQMTSVSSPLPLNPSGYTALLGYHEPLGFFAGFDIEKHRVFTTGSPSVQIDLDALHKASLSGWSFHAKTNDEITVGFRPDYLLDYIRSAKALHMYGADVEILDLLIKASMTEEVSAESIQDLDHERKVIISEISRISRDATFRAKVLEAYGHQCAVTGVQLNLLDAAHLLPVVAEHSTDDVSNGIAFAPTIHRAFDTCLIYLDENHFMRLNEKKASDLASQGLDGNINELCSGLDKLINLPANKIHWPQKEYIIQANQFRRIPGY